MELNTITDFVQSVAICALTAMCVLLRRRLNHLYKVVKAMQVREVATKLSLIFKDFEEETEEPKKDQK